MNHKPNQTINEEMSKYRNKQTNKQTKNKFGKELFYENIIFRMVSSHTLLLRKFHCSKQNHFKNDVHGSGGLAILWATLSSNTKNTELFKKSKCGV